MPEPRETHTAIDARRNARFSDVVGKDEAARLAEEEREAQRRIQRRRLEIQAERSPEYARMRAERDALTATLQRVRVEVESIPDFARGPDVQRRLRAALAASDPATDTGGEGDG